jgi:hypothetical protein
MDQMQPAEVAMQQLKEAFLQWREGLPKELRIDTVQWSNDCGMILVMMGWCYRMECIFYRSLLQYYDSSGKGSRDWALQQMHGAMFELDTIIRRATIHQVGPLLPMSL